MNFKTERNEYEFQMTSFVDVIFVLLSFFVMGSSFVSLERDFAMGYSEAQGRTAARAEDFPSNIVVELRDKGDKVGIAVGSARMADNDFVAITGTLQRINMPDLNVLVRPDATLTVQQVAQAVDAVLASPMKKVSLANLPAAGGSPKDGPVPK
jgi:biopolymer transport protein ExbD